MKLRLIQTVTLLAALTLSTVAVDAKGKRANRAGKSETVTGCLAKGDEANEYKITSADGKSWGLFSAGKVNLADHVGHKVTVTGMTTKPQKAEPATTGGASRTANEEKEHLNVSDLKMVSTSCS